jgi:HPt (histidine-containing phosphotransfer) domain-containing protein
MSCRTLRFTALSVFLAVLVLSSAWEMHALRHDGELRLQQEAKTLAKRASLHFAGISWEMDAPAARSSIFVEMEDLRLAGMLIHDREGLLEGMRRNGLWEPVPWDDLTPENSVEAAAPLMMEDVPVGEVGGYLSRRALDEELAAKARRELVRVTALAVIPCIALALLLWQLAVRRAEHDGVQALCASPSPDGKSCAGEQGAALAPSLQLPPDWDNENTRRAYLEACRAFIRDQHASAALLCRLTAREDWGELREAARALHEAARALNAFPLAEAALSVQDAALANTASAARRVEICISALAGLLNAIEKLVHDNAETEHGAKT